MAGGSVVPRDKDIFTLPGLPDGTKVNATLMQHFAFLVKQNAFKAPKT